MPEPAAPDPLAAELAAIRELVEQRDALSAQIRAGVGIAGLELARVQGELYERTPGLLAAVEAALKGHTDDPVFLGADGCGHPEPSDPDAWDAWDDDHPPGAADVGRICLLTETGRYCPACTEMVYDEEGPVGDDYVRAADCIVRRAISTALLGQPEGDGSDAT